MSRGLRCLFDGNRVHYQDLLGNGYDPSLATIISMVLSLCAAPALAYAQGHVFKLPFNRKNIGSNEEVEISVDPKSSSQTLAGVPVVVEKTAST